MKRRPLDVERLRTALRRMRRGDLLTIAERAVEIVPGQKLHLLLGDMVRQDEVARSKSNGPLVLNEVRKFHSASLAGEYYESFNVNSKNFMEKSEATEEFIEEFDRLMRNCIQKAGKAPSGALRQAFELLFSLLRRIDRDPDSVVFFADEGGAWQMGVDWRAALPAYFRCLAEQASADDFAREVDRSIADFAEHDRSRHLAAARRIAGAEQKAALRRLTAQERTR